MQSSPVYPVGTPTPFEHTPAAFQHQEACKRGFPTTARQRHHISDTNTSSLRRSTTTFGPLDSLTPTPRQYYPDTSEHSSNVYYHLPLYSICPLHLHHSRHSQEITTPRYPHYPVHTTTLSQRHYDFDTPRKRLFSYKDVHQRFPDHISVVYTTSLIRGRSKVRPISMSVHIISPPR